jgi:hypothetical protein
MQDSDSHLSLDERASSQWAQFVPQMLANTAGTLLAATIVYLYGVAAGIFKANQRILVPLGLTLAVGVVAILNRNLDDWLDNWARTSGRRPPPYLAAALLTSPFVLAAYLAIKAGDEWDKIGLSGWPRTLLPLAIVAAVDLIFMRFRRRRRIRASSRKPPPQGGSM